MCVQLNRWVIVIAKRCQVDSDVAASYVINEAMRVGECTYAVRLRGVGLSGADCSEVVASAVIEEEWSEAE